MKSFAQLLRETATYMHITDHILRSNRHFADWL